MNYELFCNFAAAKRDGEPNPLKLAPASVAQLVRAHDC